MVLRRNLWTSNLLGMTVSCLVGGAGAAILAASTIVLATPSPVLASPAFTAQTKLPCTQCHTKPGGGATDQDLTDFGKKFKANGNKVK